MGLGQSQATLQFPASSTDCPQVTLVGLPKSPSKEVGVWGEVCARLEQTYGSRTFHCLRKYDSSSF